MRLAILSDVHANLPALRATLDAVSHEAVNHVVCLGDIVGYNADPAECIDLLRAADARCVAGNHDRGVTGQLPLSAFPRAAAQALQWTRDQIGSERIDFLAALPVECHIMDALVAVHGALHAAPQRETVYLDRAEVRLRTAGALAAHASGARICAFGHTHHLGIFGYREGREFAVDGDDAALEPDALYLVNPGTVGEPRSTEIRATFMVLDTVRHCVAVHRVAYDTATIRAGNRAAGLPSVSGANPLRSFLRRRAALALGRRGQF